MGKAYKRLINEMYIPYSGCLIEKLPGGNYGWAGRTYTTLDDAKADIDAPRILNISPPKDFYRTHVEVSIVDKSGKETFLSEEQKEQYIIGRSPYELYKQQQ